MTFYRLLFVISLSLALPGCLASAVVGGSSAVASSIHDERSVGEQLDDITLVSKIDARLVAERDMPSRWVSVEVVDGRVILTGHLPTNNHIQRALYIIKDIKGVRSVDNRLEVGKPKIGNMMSDTWITTQVKRRLWNDKLVSGFKIHVETVNGKVYLQGIVNELIERQRAKDIAHNTKGVTAVVDLMQSGR